MKKHHKILIRIGIFLFALIIVYWIVLARYFVLRPPYSHIDTASVTKHVPRLFGFAIDSFNLEKGNVGRNQNLGQILQKYNLPDHALSSLMLYRGKVFDVRKIRRGNNYTAFLSRDTLYRLQYFVYEHSPTDYVIFDFRDSVRVSLKRKDVITTRKKVEGEITTSLWDAIKKNNINPLVALELSEIYAWTIDFFGLQRGDRFTVVYDEMFVDTLSVGLGHIYAASFLHGGHERFAIPFMQDSVESYFDSDGTSLRRAFLKAPLRFSRISSRFSGSRMHPILKIRRPHFGVDYAAPIGTPVYSIGDGRILSAGYQGGAGRIVKVRHNGLYTTSYMHLSGFARDIRAGKYVSQGELLGYVGSSGLSSGPHLDFRVYKNGSPIDPLKMESPPVDPVKPENMPDFNLVKEKSMKMLKETPNFK